MSPNGQSLLFLISFSCLSLFSSSFPSLLSPSLSGNPVFCSFLLIHSLFYTLYSQEWRHTPFSPIHSKTKLFPSFLQIFKILYSEFIISRTIWRKKELEVGNKYACTHTDVLQQYLIAYFFLLLLRGDFKEDTLVKHTLTFINWLN